MCGNSRWEMLTLNGGLCFVVLALYWCAETDTCFLCWADPRKLHLNTRDRIQSLKQHSLNKRKGMDNVRNCDSYINISSSQTYRS
jgi:hypothetical protein